ncbi:unnamed protein product, partial [Owenia fusiformis]
SGEINEALYTPVEEYYLCNTGNTDAIEKSFVGSLKYCAILCTKHEQCVRFNYNQGSGECHLWADMDIHYLLRWSQWTYYTSKPITGFILLRSDWAYDLPFLTDARDLCHQFGFNLATMSELNTAHSVNSFDVCVFGWVNDDSGAYGHQCFSSFDSGCTGLAPTVYCGYYLSETGTTKALQKFNEVNSILRCGSYCTNQELCVGFNYNLGSHECHLWADMEIHYLRKMGTWTHFTSKPLKGFYLIRSAKAYDLPDATSADALCQQFGGHVSTMVDLNNAHYNSKLDVCRFGWVNDNGFARQCFSSYNKSCSPQAPIVFCGGSPNGNANAFCTVP